MAALPHHPPLIRTSVAGLVISAVALAITVLALAACVGFIGLIGMSSANWV